jgi:hypothetical protein
VADEQWGDYRLMVVQELKRLSDASEKMTEKLGAISEEVRAIDRLESNDEDKEERIKKLEAQRWFLMGAVAAVQVAVKLLWK